MTTPYEITVDITSEDEARCLREAMIISSNNPGIDTLGAAQTELAVHYRLQLAAFVTPETRRGVVGGLVASGLPETTQLAISDESVLGVFNDLLRAGALVLIPNRVAG